MKRVLLALAAVALAAVSAHGQSAAPQLQFPAASPNATLKQQVGVTDIEINYARPSARGRKVFGGLVPYGEVWRTGANAATRISFSTPVKLNGIEVPAGQYELFTIPQAQEWTVIIHQAKSQWGAYSYNPANDVARIPAKPLTLPSPIETFTIGMSAVVDNTATLYLAWENVRVPVQLEVDVASVLAPQIEAVMASDAPKKPYAQAAMFYLNYGLDLNKAVEWMDAAIKAQPEAFYYAYHKARMLVKLGRKAEALAAAEQSLAAARKANGSLRDEYVRLNEELIATLR